LLGTTAEQLLRVLEVGTSSTNVFLRRLHNFALDMNWLPRPVIPKRRWPAVHYKSKCAITSEEHQQILEHEKILNKMPFINYAAPWQLAKRRGHADGRGH
jgi:hypothetical protein